MECMQIQGLSDSSSSDSESDVSMLETTNSSCTTAEQSNDEPLINENDLYEKYKEALKLLQASDYDKSENLLKELLSTKLLNIVINTINIHLFI
jgi:predicted Zn-dependent protease